ncbi:MAG: glycosyl hydrolase family 28-related protein, partial [Cyanobacteria bacterium P01_E01_bin.6]
MYIEAFIQHIDITDIPAIVLNSNPNLSSAIANDGLDDSMAIQAAIDWMATQRNSGFTGESTIYIPEGIFEIGETVRVNTSDVNIVGAGSELSVLKNTDTFQIGIEGLPDSATEIDSANRDAYLFNIESDANNVSFKHMTLNGPEVHGAIFGYGINGLEISKIEFNSFLWSSIRLFNVEESSINNNTFIDAGGQAREDSGQTGGSIYATFLKDSEIFNNVIDRTEEREGNVFGIKGRRFVNTHIHHNTIRTSFAIELPFENDSSVEIDRNLFQGGGISIPKHGGGALPDDGLTFHIHHNFFTSSYSFEWARNGVRIDSNVFYFDPDQDEGNLITNHGGEPAGGPTSFHNNLIFNPGRGIFWGRAAYNNFSFNNNEIFATDTSTPRLE